MVWLLWAIHAVGPGTHGPVRQPDGPGLGDAKVQALQRPQDPHFPVPTAVGEGSREPLRALAAQQDGRVCLMGAV